MNYQFEQISAEKVVLKGSFNEWLIISITFHPYHGGLSNVFQGNIFLIRMQHPIRKRLSAHRKKRSFAEQPHVTGFRGPLSSQKQNISLLTTAIFSRTDSCIKNRWSMNAFKSTRFSQKIMLYNMNSSWSRWCSRI